MLLILKEFDRLIKRFNLQGIVFTHPEQRRADDASQSHSQDDDKILSCQEMKFMRKHGIVSYLDHRDDSLIISGKLNIYAKEVAAFRQSCLAAQQDLDVYGYTKLMQLVLQGDYQATFDYLYSAESYPDPNQIAAGTTALHLAVTLGLSKLIRLLTLFDANVNLKLENGLTALHIAAANGDQACYHELLACGADATIPLQGAVDAASLYQDSKVNDHTTALRRRFAP